MIPTVPLKRRSPHCRDIRIGSSFGCLDEQQFVINPSSSRSQFPRSSARTIVSRPPWANNVTDYFCTPWGGGLCVPQRFAARYSQIVRELRISNMLDRNGQNLFCDGDDLFSWLCVGSETGFAITLLLCTV